MLGPPKLRCLDQPVTVSRDTLVPPDSFYQYLDAKLDLTFVRDRVKDLYADSGQPSIDPMVFFKLQLIIFFEGLRSGRRLLETVALSLAHRWYLGYGLDEPVPTHSSLTRIRTRLGLAIFQRFFHHVVELCQEAGLVWGKELFFDGTKVEVALVTLADVMDNTPMLDLLHRVCVRWKLRLQRVVGDAKYGTIENIRAPEAAASRAYVPLPNMDGPPYYGPSRFQYDPDRDECQCPQGQPLRPERVTWNEDVVVYRAEASTCNHCPVKRGLYG